VHSNSMEIEVPVLELFRILPSVSLHLPVKFGSFCYGLNVKRPPQAPGLNAWSPTGGAILGGDGNFRR
jgi:hypothetical protein